MLRNRHLKFALLGAAALAASAGFAWAADWNSGGSIALPKDMVAAASAFSDYMSRAADVRADFRDGEAVHQSLKTGVAYEQVQFEAGMISYGALVAMQDPGFLAGVSRAAHSEADRQALAARLEADPAQVLRLDGADVAAREVESALMSRATPVADAGKAVKQAAYDVQHEAWSKERIANLPGRLKEVKLLSTSPYPGTDGDGARLSRAMLQLPPAGGGTPAVSPVVARSLALAAVAILGEAKPSDMPQVQPLLTEYFSADCLHMAKLMLYQCMAVASPHYENVFCLGQHALADTGQCVAAAVTASPDRTPPPPRVILASTAPVKAPPKASRHHHRRHS
ncbi:hypothetical protein ACO2Q3_21815 [Caulobacter sp. KR2-114]|uniref:hypothetical protein n=1 Tax=Caulobacter sp. KR2-114 TaxID=3400912 RepID=UPI003C00E596